MRSTQASDTVNKKEKVIYHNNILPSVSYST